MVTTRNTSFTKTSDFDHILINVLGLTSSHPIYQTLDQNGYISAQDIFFIRETDLERLRYKETDTSTAEELLFPHKQKLRLFQDFVRSLINEKGAVDYSTIGQHEFNEFLVTGGTITPPSTVPAPISSSTSKASLKTDFQKGIRRDKSHYHELKTDKQWDAWRRSTIATARTHGCEDIFDSTYIPTTLEAKELFQEKQKFIYAVFQEKLLTDKGKYLV